jgi:hypothetical protein
MVGGWWVIREENNTSDPAVQVTMSCSVRLVLVTLSVLVSELCRQTQQIGWHTPGLPSSAVDTHAFWTTEHPLTFPHPVGTRGADALGLQGGTGVVSVDWTWQ